MSQIQAVKSASDIVEVIGERIKLTRSGQNFRGLCPFHGEKTPSFFVHPQLQRYRCFGCSAHGDVIGFLQEYDHLTFSEALQTLADRAGITLEQFHRTKEDDDRDQALAVLDLTREYYHYILTEHAVGEKARNYLANRGVTQESIKLFQLGYALSSWDGLLKFLTKKKHFTDFDLERAGLVIRTATGRTYDRFRDRIMFPLRNHRGQVVGFSGRTLSADAKEAKYINSPETLVYHKSEMLFGYSELQKEIAKKKNALVVEGEFDVISSAQAHVNAVVAIKGSALTEQQVRLLSRCVESITLSLDADDAGIKATQRAIEIVKNSPLELRVLELNALGAGADQAKDPDEIARYHPKEWRELSKKSVTAYQYLLDMALRRHNPDSLEGKKNILAELASPFAQIPHAVEQDYYLQKLSTALNVKAELVKKDIERLAKIKSNPSFRKKLLPATDENSKKVLSVHTLVARFKTIFSLMLRIIDAGAGARLSSVNISPLLEDISMTEGVYEQALAGLFTEVVNHWTEHPSDTLKSYTQMLSEDKSETLFDLLADQKLERDFGEMTIDQLLMEFGILVKEQNKQAVHNQMQVISHKISKLDSVANHSTEEENELQLLLAKLVDLQKKLR